MNKHTLVSERQYDDCLDHVYTLNEETPIIKTFEKEDVAVDPDLVFGLDTRLFTELEKKILIDGVVSGHQSSEVDILHIQSIKKDFVLGRKILEETLRECPKDEIYRLKGFVDLEGEGLSILNFAFGRWDITLLRDDFTEHRLRLTGMLARGRGDVWRDKFLDIFGREIVHIDSHPA